MSGPDDDAVAELWAAHAGRVQAYALRHVDPETAQEVVAETFVVAWRRAADVPADALPWLLVVARNTIANHRRSASRRRALETEIARVTQVAHAPADVAVGERDAVLRALATLTEAEREALLLVAWDGLTSAQAAVVAGCSRSAMSVRLVRARRRLVRALSPADADAVGSPGRPDLARRTP